MASEQIVKTHFKREKGFSFSSGERKRDPNRQKWHSTAGLQVDKIREDSHS